MTSSTPSGMPGNSGSAPRPKARMTGSAIRKPSIQPGYGRARALSMIEGRTMASGLSPAVSSRAISVRALVKV